MNKYLIGVVGVLVVLTSISIGGLLHYRSNYLNSLEEISILLETTIVHEEQIVALIEERSSLLHELELSCNESDHLLDESRELSIELKEYKSLYYSSIKRVRLITIALDEGDLIYQGYNPNGDYVYQAAFKDDELSSYTEIYYDANGKPVRQDAFDSEGNLIWYMIVVDPGDGCPAYFHYDPDGVLTRIRFCPGELRLAIMRLNMNKDITTDEIAEWFNL